MNINLVKGEALIGQSKRSTWNQAFQKSFGEGMEMMAVQKAKKAQATKAINNKVAGYINQLSSDIDLTELTDSQNKAVSNYLVDQRNDYAEAASRIARIEDTSSGEYLDARDKMNSIQRSFSNLAGQLNGYKEDKISYLKDFDDRRVSDGNEIGSLSNAAKLYTNEGDMGIGPGGQLTFYNELEGNYENYSTIQKPFLKDFKAADSILQMNESVYNSGQALSGARKNMLRNKMKNMISSGGRDTLLSLASDDFMIEGGLNIQDPSLFEPGNEDLLLDMVLNSYMDALSDTAAQGATDKRPARGRGSGGFSGAMQDEINVSGPVVNKAMQLANMATLNVPANQREEYTSIIVDEINSIDPTAKERPYISRGTMYNLFLQNQKEDVEDGFSDGPEARDFFKKNYGMSQIYKYNPSSPGESRGIAINTDDPQDLYEFFIKNSNLSSKVTNYHLGKFNEYAGGNQTVKNKEKNNTESSGSYDNL